MAEQLRATLKSSFGASGRQSVLVWVQVVTLDVSFSKTPNHYCFVLLMGGKAIAPVCSINARKRPQYTCTFNDKIVSGSLLSLIIWRLHSKRRKKKRKMKRKKKMKMKMLTPENLRNIKSLDCSIGRYIGGYCNGWISGLSSFRSHHFTLKLWSTIPLIIQ